MLFYEEEFQKENTDAECSVVFLDIDGSLQPCDSQKHFKSRFGIDEKERS